MCASVSDLLDSVREHNPGQSEFHQAVEEVLESVVPVANAHPEMLDAAILERLLEPDRIVRFRVTWEDDDGAVHVNRGWRVQYSNALGPYKGGLRFHPSVDSGVLKFLAFEQTFKNALTGLPLGAGKGGSDFDPKGRSDREIMRFCQSFMTQLWRHIGPETDVPAGDIGVGSREIGYLFGQYKRLAKEWSGAMTGKALTSGGIELRTEATGYGAVLFAQAVVRARRGESLEGKTAVVSGAGNVALHAAEKLISLGAKVLALSDSGGLMHVDGGLSNGDLQRVIEVKTEKRGSLSDVVDSIEGASFTEDGAPWEIECDIALPCATQNELGEEGASTLARSGTFLVVEGANMPTTAEAAKILHEGGVMLAPGKAANAGGVAVSGLEMAQNAGKHPWSRDRVEQELDRIMCSIHAACQEEGATNEADSIDYVRGANVAGFRRVARAMVAGGLA